MVRNSEKINEILNEIFKELDRALLKFPTLPTDPIHAFNVVQEEIGETAKEILQNVYEPHKTNKNKVRQEAIQSATMILRFLISLDKYQYVPGEQHEQ